MICSKCKVDLGEEYSLCPLCSAQAEDSPPALTNQRTAEYPDVTYRPFRKPYTLIAAVIYAVICAGSAATEYAMTKSFSITALVILILPCVWTVFVRPFIVKHRRIGNYIVYDAFFLSILSVYFSKVYLSSTDYALSALMPQICAIGCTILLCHSLFRPKSSRGDIIYALILSVFCLGLLIFTLFYIPNSFTAIPCFAACVLTLLIIRSNTKEEFTDELKARFHF